MDLAELCYRVTKKFPWEEAQGMTSQIRRAATAIPSNIAEGRGREGSGEFIQFLRIAQGSLKELETHLILAFRVGPHSLLPGREAVAVIGLPDEKWIKP